MTRQSPTKAGSGASSGAAAPSSTSVIGSPARALVPVVFVLLWSTGFIGARYGLPHAEPATFLAIRMVAAVALMVPFALATRAPWPHGPRAWLNAAIAGVLMHAIYLGGVFISIHQGVPAAMAAVIVGLQPLLTAVLAIPMLGERPRPRQWAGLLLGLCGVILVLADKIAPAGSGLLFQGFPAWAPLFSVGSLVAITVGTLFQKRHCSGQDLRTGTIIQYVASFLVLLPVALLFETRVVDWAPEFIGALVWLTVVLSLGAVSLLYVLLRRGAASETASLFYLVPLSAAVIAWILFDEAPGALGLCGMALTAAGVWLVVGARRR